MTFALSTVTTTEQILAISFDFGVISTTGGIINTRGYGISGLTGASSLGIHNSGTVFGSLGGISLAENGFSITNNASGSITGGNTGINSFFSGVLDSYITNHGLISGGSSGGDGILIQGAGVTIANTGTIVGINDSAIQINGSAASGTSTVINSGTIMVNASPASNIYAYDGSSKVDEIYNSGFIFGGIDTEFGDDLVVNSGHIEGEIDLSSGNDTFDGRGGTVTGDVLGGNGDDTFIVDSAQLSLIEALGAGTDAVFSWVTFALGDNFENLTLLGGEDLRGIGNELDNVVTGNAGDNVMNGASGADYLYGGLGDDLLAGAAGSDRLYGDDGDDELRGGDGLDRLFGGADNDVLRGGMGVDYLTGGTGADVFQFVYSTDAGSDPTQADHIMDFSAGEDMIDLSALTAAPLVYQGNGAFVAGQASVRYIVSGADANVLIDLDGDLWADMRITVHGVTSFTEADFVL